LLSWCSLPPRVSHGKRWARLRESSSPALDPRLGRPEGFPPRFPGPQSVTPFAVWLVSRRRLPSFLGFFPFSLFLPLRSARGPGLSFRLGSRRTLPAPADPLRALLAPTGARQEERYGFAGFSNHFSQPRAFLFCLLQHYIPAVRSTLPKKLPSRTKFH
jgi:hypothetical protein